MSQLAGHTDREKGSGVRGQGSRGGAAHKLRSAASFENIHEKSREKVFSLFRGFFRALEMKDWDNEKMRN